MMYIPDGIIFACFLLGTAGVTGTAITWLKNPQGVSKFSLGVALAGIITSRLLGFTVEEILLLCLPIIIGCSILTGSMLRRTEFGSMHQEEKARLIEV
jgi:hypothetical protein